MEARVIKNEIDYQAALAHVADFMDAASGSREEEERDLFSLHVEQYEREHFRIAPPDPIAASVRFALDGFSLLGDNRLMETYERTLRILVLRNGKSPFKDWFLSLRDKPTQARIQNRIDRLRLGTLGDYQSVGGGVFELRIHFGPGYRVYFGLHGAQVILLLCGGDKSTQARDIADAQRYWKEFLADEN